MKFTGEQVVRLRVLAIVLCVAHTVWQWGFDPVWWWLSTFLGGLSATVAHDQARKIWQRNRPAMDTLPMSDEVLQLVAQGHRIRAVRRLAKTRKGSFEQAQRIVKQLIADTKS